MYRTRPTLYGKAAAILSPENLTVNMGVIANLECQVYLALLDWVVRSIRLSVVCQFVEVLSEQFLVCPIFCTSEID